MTDVMANKIMGTLMIHYPRSYQSYTKSNAEMFVEEIKRVFDGYDENEVLRLYQESIAKYRNPVPTSEILSQLKPKEPKIKANGKVWEVRDSDGYCYIMQNGDPIGVIRPGKTEIEYVN